MWAFHAKRPLSANELQHAIVINESQALPNTKDPVERNVILDSYKDLIIIDDEIVQPLHYSVKEFVMSYTFNNDNLALVQSLRDANEWLTVGCLLYLQRAPLYDGPKVDSNSLKNLLWHLPFIRYAASDQKLVAAFLQIRHLGPTNWSYSSAVHSTLFVADASIALYSTQLINVPWIREKYDSDSVPDCAVHRAAAAGDLDAVLELYSLDYGTDEPDELGVYPLYYACEGGCETIVTFFLAMKMEVNVCCGFYGNPLQVASFHGYKNIVQMLLDDGADPNIQGGYYETALQAASSRGHRQTVELLLGSNADINIVDGYHGTALQAAASRAHEDIVQMFFEHGADVNLQGGVPGSALTAASGAQHKSICSTALGWAAFRGSEDIVKMLLEKGADVDAYGDSFWGTPLQAAALGGDESIVMMLLERGADVNIQSGHDGCALQAASSEGYENI
ncbi:hypothetical protein AJ80_09527, partial [Polytolypa hystricis UAMH7299]